MASVKILSLQLEGFKRIQAISIKPTADGLTVIGGKNGHGKTSVIDAIMWALGGDKYKPNEASHRHDDSNDEIEHKEMDITIELSNGIIVQRKGQRGSLKVTDANEMSGNQSLLNRFIENLALDLPKFIDGSPKKKADTLLKIIGVGDELEELEFAIKNTFTQRTAANKLEKQAKIFFDKAPEPLKDIEKKLDVADLVAELDKILAIKKDLQELIQNDRGVNAVIKDMKDDNNSDIEEIKIFEQKIKIFQQRIVNRRKDMELKNEISGRLNKKIAAIKIDDEAPIREKIQNSSAVNEKISHQLKIVEEYKIKKDLLDVCKKDSKKLDDRINILRIDRMKLLKGVEMPLDGLSLEDEELTYKGFKWDGMSSVEQLKVATAIVKKLNPRCGFVLLDKLEQFDLDTLNEFGDWAKNEGLQIIATRVSVGDECSIIIEDGNII